jgi:hypothetical protein
MKVTFSIFALISVVLTSVTYNSGVNAKVTPDSKLKTTVTGSNITPSRMVAVLAIIYSIALVNSLFLATDLHSSTMLTISKTF